nr:DNA helicase [Tanacetum cinerariifolium]
MHHFGGLDEGGLNPDFVQGLVHVLDEHNGLVRLFRTSRDICRAGEVLGFKIRLYRMGGVRGYELPTSSVLGGIVFEDGPKSRTDFDVIIEFRGRPPQRINKLHQPYTSLQYPLLFVFGKPGFYPDLKLKPQDGSNKGKNVSMNAYYRYQLHPRVMEFGLIFKTRRLFQHYVVTAFCAMEQNRLDYIRTHQNDLRSYFLSGLYDVVGRGDREGIAVGSKIMLPYTFTRGPRYMYNHYLDALAICRSPRNPQFFITFTCNVKWLEIKRYMSQYPNLTPADKAYIVYRVFEQKVKAFVNFLKEVQTSGYVIVGEFFYFRMLLCHQKGCRSSVEVRTVNGQVLPTYRAACEALGMLGDEKEWDIALKELVVSATSEAMRDDIPSKISEAIGIPIYHVNTLELQGYILYELEEILNGFGKSVIDFGLPPLLQHLLEQLKNKLLMEEKNYKRKLVLKEAAQLVPNLNHNQRKIYDLIINACANNRQELLFIYGHDGTLKCSFGKQL